jgi:DNA-binding Lrp family transcriptional regulator
MSKGYIKIHRKILDNGVFENGELLKVFVWCILRANTEPATVYGINLKIGQFVTGRNSAAQELKIPPTTVYDRIKKLEQLKYIKLESNTKNTIITVVNYKQYQTAKVAKKRDLDAVSERFSAEVMVYANQYTEDVLEAFISYWTEPNRSKTKLAYELQKTFEIGRRLKTWAKNKDKFNNTNTAKPAIFDSWQAARNIVNNG